MQPKQTPLAIKPFATVRDKAINELSGIAKSRRYLDTYWVHNDSGDKAHFFAIRSDGSRIQEIKLKDADNVDWEDIATDGKNLFISDLGNNNNRRQNLTIYVVPEPNPKKTDHARPTQRLLVTYPDQTSFPMIGKRHFDCEALFIYKNKLYVLTKHRSPDGIFPETGTTLYRLDTAFTDRPNVLTKLDSATDLGGWVTAADVSPDETTLAVLCHLPQAGVWLFDLARGTGDTLLSRPARYVALSGVRQCEALCFDDNATLIIGNEQGDLFRLKTAEATPKAQGTRTLR